MPASRTCNPPAAGKVISYARASLYERPVNLETAKAAHAEFRRVMREAGVKVLTVRDVMAYGVGDHSAQSFAVCFLGAPVAMPRSTANLPVA